MKRLCFRRYIILLVVALALVGCGSYQTQVPAPEGISQEEGVSSPGENPLVDTQWRLAVYGDPAALKSTLPDKPPTLNLGQDELSGSTGCNTYGGNYQLDGDAISFENLFWTEVGCLAPGLSEQEADFLALLPAVASYDLDGDALSLHSQGKVLQFQALVSAADKPLVGRLWQLEVLVKQNITGTIVEPVPTTTLITAWFENGTISGGTGCNRYGAAYQVDAEKSSLEVGPLEMTAAECPDPESAELESRFVEALRTAESFRIEGDRLRIGHPGGELIFRPQADTAADENAVFSAVLREWDGGVGPYVINEATAFNQPGVTLDETLEFVQAQLPRSDEDDPFALQPETWEDFKRINASPSSLEGVLHTALPFEFTREAWELGDPKSLQAFRERYPAALGVFTFSRVGFNPAGDQALVYMGVESGDFTGGYYSLLVKDKGLWSSVVSFMIWGL
jgi:heat shock protein HslJ